RSDLVAQHAIGRGDQAHVDPPRSAGPHREHLAFLDRPEQLRLDVLADLSDLVEEEGAAVGTLEAAGARGDRAGEGPLLVAEELALAHPVGERLHVDGDERLADAIAPEVEQARRQLLPSPALPLDEDGRPAGRNTLHELEQRPALGTLRDDAVGAVAGADLLA